MFHSPVPWSGSGYGQLVRTFGGELTKLGHQVAVSAHIGLMFGMTKWEGMTIYPGSGTIYSMNVGAAHAQHFGADVFVAIMDSWTCQPLLEMMIVAQKPVVLWSPVDQAPPSFRILASAEMVSTFACYSEFGTRELEKAGCKNVTHVPIGIDLNTFKPRDRRKGREALGFGMNDYLVGIIAANTCPHSRKAWAQQFEGFSLFHAKYPDARLYVHAEPEPDAMVGWRLNEIAAQYGISEVTYFRDRYSKVIGTPASKMAEYYSAFDVLLSASAGEGFCVPLIEAQACGTPVICGDWTAMPELFHSGAMIDKKDAMRWRAPQSGYWFYPNPNAVADALDTVRNSTYDRSAMRQFVKERYDSRRIVKSLVSVLKDAKPLTAESEAGQ
jgi:glycosyltransferase involved in cell wall biosynthesis